jgi:hypothetical protein
MSSPDDYRTNAEDCLRMAKAAAEDRDRPLWATMAQSWLRLAEHAERGAPMADGGTIAADRVEDVTLAPGTAVEGQPSAGGDPKATVGSSRATN